MQACSCGARCAVGRPQEPQLDLPLVEVLLELRPLLRCGVAVLLPPAAAERRWSRRVLVVPPRCRRRRPRRSREWSGDIQVAEQRGADVDGQPGVDQVGGEDSAEVVGGEPVVPTNSGWVLAQLGGRHFLRRRRQIAAWCSSPVAPGRGAGSGTGRAEAGTTPSRGRRTGSRSAPCRR